MTTWFCPTCFGSYQPGSSVSCDGDPDGYCMYCEELSPHYKRSRKETMSNGQIRETVYFFCDEDCADKWMDK